MCKSSVLWLLILATSIASCNDIKNLNSTVKHQGSLMQIMSGNLEATASLDSLQSLPHLYALGALEHLEGEIQVFDGVSYVSKSAAAASVVLESTFDHKAALLVYAQVPEWSEAITLDRFSENSVLEKQIKAAAILQGIAVEHPFPFLLKGTAATLDWHVINWIKGDTIHNHKKHKTSGAKGTLENRDVEVIGFYSENHQTVFTHHATFLHLHFKTDNQQVVAGHVDGLTGDQLQLYLPQPQ
ncbi:MAG: alpha-acetolactate decarboxylase [Rubritalea sp.]|jgi:alpha-acetolactate decarboxylase